MLVINYIGTTYEFNFKKPVSAVAFMVEGLRAVVYFAGYIWPLVAPFGGASYAAVFGLPLLEALRLEVVMTFRQWLADFSRSQRAREMWAASEGELALQAQAQRDMERMAIEAFAACDASATMQQRVRLFRPRVVTNRADSRSVAVDVVQVIRRVPNSVFAMGTGSFVTCNDSNLKGYGAEPHGD